MRILGIGTAFIALIVVFTVVKGALVVQLWDWFILPKFAAAPPLSLAEGIGIGLFISLLTMSGESSNDYDRKDITETLVLLAIKGVLLYAFIYVAAVIVHSFV